MVACFSTSARRWRSAGSKNFHMPWFAVRNGRCVSSAANTTVGAGRSSTEAVARAKPDGHTLLMQYSGYHVGNPALFAQIKWHPTKDFVPVALVMRAPHVFAVGPSAPAATLKDLIELGRRNGKGLFYASSGNGSI